jgi:hypothetical protein
MTAQVEIASPPGMTDLPGGIGGACGRRVIGRDGRVLGEVDDVIAVAEHGACLLWVTAAAGPAAEWFVIPSGVVARVTADAVHLDRSSGDVAAAPRYDPTIPEEAYLDRLLRYYAALAPHAAGPGDRA